MKFSRLLYRYLCHSKGQSEAKLLFKKHLEMLGSLREMSDIIKNKSIKLVPLPSIADEMENTMTMF